MPIKRADKNGSVFMCTRGWGPGVEGLREWVGGHREREKVWICAHSDTHLFIESSQHLQGKLLCDFSVYATEIGTA